MLSEKQILLLNTLMYTNSVVNPAVSQRDMTVKDLVSYLEKELKRAEKKKKPEFKEAEKIQFLIDSINQDKQIQDLHICSPKYETDTGAKMACFVDENGQAYAVFAGTGGNEWPDNTDAATRESSLQQRKALSWFNDLPYDNIYVSGHSKGGNKAMFCAIQSDKAGKCLAFDAEGFSKNFTQEYEDQIARKKGDIKLVASYRDYVNSLLIPIAGEIEYVRDDGWVTQSFGIKNIGEYHNPMALFKHKNGPAVYEVAPVGKQDTFTELERDFVTWFIEHGSNADQALVFASIGEITQLLLGKKELTPELLDMYSGEALTRIIQYLGLYMRDLKIINPELYLKYRGKLFLLFARINLVNVFKTNGKYEIFQLSLTTGIAGQAAALGNRIFGGGKTCRDFSQEARDMMINAAKEVEKEPFWRVDRWDCWYRLEQTIGILNIEHYTGKVDKYFRKIIDINDASAGKIEKIFNDVYRVNSQYCQYFSDQKDIASQVKDGLQQEAANIQPSQVSFTDL